MKKKLLSMLLAVTMCTAMVGTTCFAAGGPLDDPKDTAGNTITGDAGYAAPIYKVDVPTVVAFGIDPFTQMEQDGSQIYSADLKIINKSNVSVRVNANVKLKGKDGANVLVKTTEADVKEDDNSKLVYIAAEVPSDVTEATASAADYDPVLKTSATNGGKYYLASMATGLPSDAAAVTEMVDCTGVAGDYTKSLKVGLNDGAAGTDLLFALEKATYVPYFTDASLPKEDASAFKQVAANKKGTATFRFSGKVNTKADWAAADITATIKYDFLGLTSDNYTNLSAKEAAIDASTKTHAYVLEETEPVFSAGTVGKVLYTKGSGDKELASIQSMKAAYDGVDYDVFNALGSTWEAATDDGAGTITLAQASYKGWADKTPAENPTLTIAYTLTDGTTGTQTITLVTH